jgi:hypothetical protein
MRHFLLTHKGVGTILNDDAGPGTITSTSSLAAPIRVLEGNTGTQTVTFSFTNTNPNGKPRRLIHDGRRNSSRAAHLVRRLGVDYILNRIR